MPVVLMTVVPPALVVIIFKALVAPTMPLNVVIPEEFAVRL